MKNQVIIFDIDGTAINSPVQKLPSKQLVEVINQLKKKYYFCAATGRVWTFAKGILQDLNLVDPCIISAGTQICNPQTGAIFDEKLIPNKSLKLAIKILQQNPSYKLLYNDYPENDYLFGGIDPEKFIARENVYFLEQIFVPEDIALETFQKLNMIEGITCVMVVAQKPGLKDLHIINKNATKEHAIVKLLRRLNINIKDTIGIGDGHNDIHLFNAVHYKVAVGNAVPELKERADLIVDSVENDGMAKYLKTLL